MPLATCSELIEVYRNNPSIVYRYDNDGYPNMGQLDLTNNKAMFPQLHKSVVAAALNLLSEYKRDVPETKFWPSKISFENFRIKHYAPGGHDRFDLHIDAANIDTCKRYLAFFWYLNDVPEGGETTLPNGVMMKPEVGKALVFPPMWMFPHSGMPVIKGEKFLLSSYLHFNESHWNDK